MRTLKLNRPMAKWRKRLGVGITHMMSRKARALRYQDRRGVR